MQNRKITLNLVCSKYDFIAEGEAAVTTLFYSPPLSLECIQPLASENADRIHS